MTNNSFLILKDFLLKTEKKYLLSLIDTGGYQTHYNTTDNTPSPLMFKPINFRNIENAKLMKMLPNVKQEMHTDEVKNNKRKTILIHPLTNNYSPCITKDGLVSQTALINTQSEHAVYNNDNTRLNLQIAFDIDFKYFLDKTHSIWKFINSLYLK